jgi:hypothetical protein
MDTKGFQCPVCHEFHEQPQKGYLKNTALAKLCEKKAKKVSRSPQAKSFETDLDELKLKMNELAQENDLGVDKIETFYDDLRDEVQLHLEESIASLKKQSLALIQEIDERENETKLKFNTNYSLRTNKFLSTALKFNQEWADFLKQFEIDDEKLSLASSQAKLLKHNANREIDLFLVKAQNVLEFSKGTSFLGRLVADDTSESYARAVDTMLPHYMSPTMENMKKAAFKLLSNGNVCVAYCEQSENLFSIVVYDKCLNKLYEKCLTMSAIFHGFELVEVSEDTVLCFFFKLEKDDCRTNKSYFMKLDYYLKSQQINTFGFEIVHANAHQDKLYLLTNSRESKSKHIYVYDESLNMLEDIQLENSESMPFYVPMSVTKIRVAEKYFFFLDGKKVLAMDRLSGAIKRSLSISGSDFVLDSSKDRILAYDDELEELAWFDLNGKSRKIKLEKDVKLELVDYDHDGFVFYDAKSACLHF